MEDRDRREPQIRRPDMTKYFLGVMAMVAMAGGCQSNKQAPASHASRCHVSCLHRPVAKNRGALRALVACSNANASFSSTGSLNARPKNEIPSGRPKTSPAGTVMLG